MPHLLSHHSNNDKTNNNNNNENRVKKILSHVHVSSILPQRISFHKSDKSAPPSARSSSSSLSSSSSSSSSSESKEVVNEDGFQEPKKILCPKAKVQGNQQMN